MASKIPANVLAAAKVVPVWTREIPKRGKTLTIPATNRGCYDCIHTAGELPSSKVLTTVSMYVSDKMVKTPRFGFGAVMALDQIVASPLLTKAHSSTSGYRLGLSDLHFTTGEFRVHKYLRPGGGTWHKNMTFTWEQVWSDLSMQIEADSSPIITIHAFNPWNFSGVYVEPGLPYGWWYSLGVAKAVGLYQMMDESEKAILLSKSLSQIRISEHAFGYGAGDMNYLAENYIPLMDVGPKITRVGVPAKASTKTVKTASWDGALISLMTDDMDIDDYDGDFGDE